MPRVRAANDRVLLSQTRVSEYYIRIRKDELTLFLRFHFDFGFLVNLLSQFPANVAEVGHGNTSIFETLLSSLELVIGELQPSKEVSDALRSPSTR